MPDYMKTNNKSREDKSQTGRSYSNKSCQCQRHLRDIGSIPVLGGSPGEGHSNPLQYSGLENSIDCIAHGSQSQTRLSYFYAPSCVSGLSFIFSKREAGQGSG